MIFISILVFSFLNVRIKAQSSGFGISSMPPTILTLQMIIDFAVEKNWKQVVFFDCKGGEDCTRPYAKPLIGCFSKKGIHISIKSLSETTDLPTVLRVEIHRVGVILIIDDIDLNSDNNLLRNIMLRNKNIRTVILGGYASWLLLSTKWNSTQIFDAVKDWPIGVDSDVTVAMSFLSADVIQSVLRQFSNKTCVYLRNYGQRYDYERLRRSQSISPPESTFVQDTESISKTVMVFYTVNVYKIRVDGNASLTEEDWNTWGPSRQFNNKGNHIPKKRSDLKKSMMNFGLQNSSKFYSDDYLYNSNQDDSVDHMSAVETLMELINLFEICLNVTANITNYVVRDTPQVTKENNDLVHGITSGEIDIGAAYFDIDLDRNKMLSFSYPIIRFNRGIYFKPPETSSNIFMRPFSFELLLCVFATLVLIVAVMEVINYVTLFIHWKEDQEHFGLGEAALWCLSIMCVQGSPWTPRTRAGKAVLLTSLMFALIIYNSYSGFITSILSVKSTSINNVSDFFDYDYKFGCSRSDDSYIISNENMRNFYVKALESNEMKVSEKEGLEKTIDGNYAFFITETIAKRILRNALRFKRCKISELNTNTPGTLALPISNDSPYKKIINLSILRMWQYGMIHKLSQKLEPPLLDCMGVLTYKQARIADVYGGFCILLIGAIGSVIIFILERAWASRQRLKGIQKRITGRTHVMSAIKRKPQSVLFTVGLPMKMIGIDHDLRGTKDKKKSSNSGTGISKRHRSSRNSGLKSLFSKSKSQLDQNLIAERTPLFPYYP